MKAKSIITIRELLIEEHKKADDAYKLFKETMFFKYKTDWISKSMNETEKELLEKLRAKFNDLSEALEEFEEYQW